MSSPAARGDDAPFHHYTLRHQITAWISTHVFDNVTYTVRHGLLRGMKRKGGLGWIPAFLSGSIETREQSFWEQLDLRGQTVYDIGAFQGLLTLFFASRAQQVVCYEPNRHNRGRLEQNVSLNALRNVQVRPVGVGSARQNHDMAFNPLMPGGASIEQNTVNQLKHASGIVVETISVTTLDEDIEENALPAPTFIKIDIEGWEIEALRGARRTLAACHPTLFLEMHGETMNEKRRKVREIVEFLVAAGYQSILHIESNTQVTPANTEVAAEGHLYCRFDNSARETRR